MQTNVTAQPLMLGKLPTVACLWWLCSGGLEGDKRERRGVELRWVSGHAILSILWWRNRYCWRMCVCVWVKRNVWKIFSVCVCVCVWERERERERERDRQTDSWGEKKGVKITMCMVRVCMCVCKMMRKRSGGGKGGGANAGARWSKYSDWLSGDHFEPPPPSSPPQPTPLHLATWPPPSPSPSSW